MFLIELVLASLGDSGYTKVVVKIAKRGKNQGLADPGTTDQLEADKCTMVHLFNSCVGLY